MLFLSWPSQLGPGPSHSEEIKFMKYLVFSLEERYSTMRNDPGTSRGICRGEKLRGEGVPGPPKGEVRSMVLLRKLETFKAKFHGQRLYRLPDNQCSPWVLQNRMLLQRFAVLFLKYHVQIFIFSYFVSLFLDEYPLCTVNFRFKKSKKKKIRSVLQNPSCTVNIVKLK